MLKESTEPDHEIMQGLSLQTYQRAMAKACSILGIVTFTPHCARTGFATDAYMDGDDFVKIREEGRWAKSSTQVSLKSLPTMMMPSRLNLFKG